MRKMVLNLHLYLALVFGLFLIVIALTGSVLPFDSQIDRLLNPHLLKVHPGAQPLRSIAETLAILREAYPRLQFGYVHLPLQADEPYVANAGPDQYFVDGYTGGILGSRPQRTLMGRIDDLHTSLMLGTTGAWIVSIATVALLLLIISGIYLWWPIRLLTVRRGRTLRQTIFDLHSVIGIYSAAFLLVLTMTALAIAFEGWWTPAVYSLTHTSPPAKKSAAPAVPQSKLASQPSVVISPDDAVRLARIALPEAQPLYVLLPGNPHSVMHVAMHFPEDRTPAGRSWVNVDPIDGRVRDVTSSRTAPPVPRLRTLNRALHTGDIEGMPTKILASLSCLMVVVQTISGYYLWWKKLRSGIVRSRPAAV